MQILIDETLDYVGGGREYPSGDNTVNNLNNTANSNKEQ